MAIDDNTSYELTGAQIKDFATKIKSKADSSSLAPVATSGDYNDLNNLPTPPTVNNGALTIKQNGTTLCTFTANSSDDKTVNIQAITADTVGAITSSMIDWTTMPGSYSTTEQKTPFTWVNGKPIYKKTFSFTLVNAEATTVNHGINNFGLLIKYEGAVVQSDTKNVPIPRTLANLNYQIGLEGVTTTSFEIDVGASGPRGKQAYITLWYTKTTD